MRVLVVDDSSDFSVIMVKLIRDMGHEADIASTGQEAIDVAAKRPPDVAFIDLTLPDLMGWDVADAIQRRCEGRPPVFVACSGRDPTAPDVRGSLGSFSEYLMKGSLQLEDLERSIESALEKASAGARQ